MCKRCEISLGYEMGLEEYWVRLVSFGDMRVEKFAYGENPISAELGICMFDYVYLFLRPKDNSL